jgi:hypothetical protein
MIYKQLLIFFSFICSLHTNKISGKDEEKAETIREHKNKSLKIFVDSILWLDKNFVDFVNKQSIVDSSNQVLIIADSIISRENIIFENLNLFFVCNYFSNEKFQISVLTTADTSKGQINGYNGKNVGILTKSINMIKIHLPGTEGLNGKGGSDGRDGNKNIAKNSPNGSMGTPGNNGKTGGNGGNGGNLVIYSFNKQYNLEYTAPGGALGIGGPPGIGGIRFLSKVTNATAGGQPDGQKFQITEKKERDGKPGKDGLKGQDGKLSRNVITEAKFYEKVSQYFYRDWDEIKQTGWIIRFQKKAIL